jgi:ureidoacrylate peracid hydrolase
MLAHCGADTRRARISNGGAMEYGDLEYRLAPERAALVIVDVQNDFCGDATVTGEPRDNSAMLAMCQTLDRLIPAARAASVPVIYVRTLHDRLSDSPVWRSRRSVPTRYEDEHCKPGTDGVDFACTSPLAGEAIVTKHRYDAFVGTDLDLLLRASDRKAIIATGCLTDICVESVVRHAVCLDYFVTVVSDACASSTREAHDEALARMGRAFGKVADSSTISSLWLKAASLAA